MKYHSSSSTPILVGSSRQVLSIVVIETFFMALMITLGVHTPLTIIAQQWGMPFQTYRFVSLLLIIISLILTLWIQWNSFKQVKIIDKEVLGWLVLFGSLCAILPLITNHPTPDDWDYIPNAVYFLQHPTESMDFKIHFLYGYQGIPIVSHSQATSLAYEYFRAVIVSFIHVDFANIYFRSSVLTGFSLPLAYYLLTTRFVTETRRALTGTVVGISLVLLSMEGPRSFGIQAFWDAYLGKLFFLSVGISIFAAFSISFLVNPSIKDWLFLFVCTMAMAGMTSSAIILYPVLAIILFVAFTFTIGLHSRHQLDIKKALSIGVLYFSSLVFGVLYAFFLYIQIKRGVTTGNPYNLSGSSIFADQFSYTFHPTMPITLVLFFLSMFAVGIFIRSWERIFILSWVVILFATFLNPLFTPWAIDTIVPRNIYWRMFFLMPFPLIGSLVGSTLSFKTAQKILLGLLPFSLAVYILVTYQQGFLSKDMKELPFENSNIAIKISESAPKGLMLAPSQLAGPITIVSSEYPQMVGRREDMLYWLGAQNQQADAILRINVGELLMGKNQDFPAFFQLLKAYPQIRSIVLRREVASEIFKNETLFSLLKRRGYKQSLIIEAYILLW